MTITWEPKAVTSGGMHYIKSGRYMITKQDGKYQASKRVVWVNLGPASSLEAAKQLCETEKAND
jgi:hypothetical protein